ncbi:short-chain dehydrogenase [Niveispirillum lacus]|uniref:Short-chain dehydrogenase n=1 Tax=Niveispirillum lacus TaxID=1981099 RepID=A0A255YYB6_9PROT|nr:SDR family oxidoreductase [Niveispirillum lacus]OYQ34227.1 short-chain dehydrogenase [Niveispirillum lacus]
MPTVVITGANRGIGLEFARQYSADGWSVIATIRDLAQPGGLSELPGVELQALSVDDPASIAAFGTALAGRSIDLLINNAGIMGPDLPAQSRNGIDAEGWLLAMKVNALAPLLIAQALKPLMAAGAKVATVSSQLGSITENETGGMYAYRASKAAINMGNRSLAADWRDDGVTCIVLHPGWVQTDMGGPKAPVVPADSVAGMRRIIAAATASDSGAFFAFDGRRIPW